VGFYRCWSTRNAGRTDSIAMPKKTILLGFEAGTGAEVKIPFHHTIVTGTTQLSGKTTTLEALVSRSGARAIAFRTKRGEADFTEAHRHAPFFKERSDWQYVQSLLEATMRERLKFERSWIIRASKNTRSLEDVHANVVRELETARGISEGVYTNLKAYLDIVLPQIRHINFATELNLVPGLNIMDLEGMSEEVQGLVIASTLEAIHKRERGVVSIVPEAWKFVPQGRHTPVQVVIEKLGREGAVIGNLVWLDSQDITGVDKPTLKNFDIWILGRQREVNEVQRTLSQIPLPKKAKPSPEDVAQLPLGHFVACFGDDVKIVYVQPAWLPAKIAADIAKDSSLLELAQEYQPKPKSPDTMESQELSELRRQLNEANETIARLRGEKGTAGKSGNASTGIKRYPDRGRGSPGVEWHSCPNRANIVRRDRASRQHHLFPGALLVRDDWCARADHVHHCERPEKSAQP
jgi:hypothetical protein